MMVADEVVEVYRGDTLSLHLCFDIWDQNIIFLKNFLPYYVMIGDK